MNIQLLKKRSILLSYTKIHSLIASSSFEASELETLAQSTTYQMGILKNFILSIQVKEDYAYTRRGKDKKTISER